MATYEEAWKKGGKALSDKYGGDYSKFESAARRYNATKNEGGKPGTYKTNMKDYGLNTQARRDEYDRRGWQHDKTTEVKSASKAPDAVKMEKRGAVNVNTGERLKINNNAVGKGGNSNSSIKNITSSTAGTAGNKATGSSMKPIALKTDLDAALSSKFGKNSATSTSNMSLMKNKVNSPKGVTALKGTILPEIEITPTGSSSKFSSPSTLGTATDPVIDKKGRQETGGASYKSGDSYERFGKGSVKTKGKGTKRERRVHYNEEGKKLGTVKRGEDKYDIKRTKRGKDADSARRVEAGKGTAEDAKYVMKNDKSKTPSARKTRKANKEKSGDNYKVGSRAKDYDISAKGLSSGYSRGSF